MDLDDGGEMRRRYVLDMSFFLAIRCTEDRCSENLVRMEDQNTYAAFAYMETSAYAN